MNETTLTILVFIGGCALVALVILSAACAMDWFEREFFGDGK